MNLLFDFYGQLLTEKQRAFFELYHHDDLSLGEIAQEHGVSRQAVYDILKRAERTLEEFESKLALVDRYWQEREVLRELDRELSMLEQDVAVLARREAGVSGWQRRLSMIRHRLRALAGDGPAEEDEGGAGN
ncbi:MAG: YlxM family DNA-binding protein [Firmicutes bacterium]|nr:YlxM family DNA-binding protein [Bacillota bacterium]